jgi:hypothetical protein
MAAPFHYALLNQGLGGVAAISISYFGTLAATRLVHTVIGLKTGLFEGEAT